MFPFFFCDCVNVRTGSDERHYDIIVSSLCGPVKGGYASLPRQVHVCPRLDKIHDDMRVALISSILQSRTASRGLLVHIDTRIDQPLQHRRTVTISGGVQRGTLSLIVSVLC